MTKIIKAVVYEKENGNKGRKYKGRFIGIINKEQTSAIVNNPILQKKLIHLQTKKLKLIGKYSDNEINNMRAVLVINKIKDKNVTNFLYFTELLDSVVHTDNNSAHMTTKQDGYIIFTEINKNDNYKI